VPSVHHRLVLKQKKRDSLAYDRGSGLWLRAANFILARAIDLLTQQSSTRRVSPARLKKKCKAKFRSHIVRPMGGRLER
jgi:hypothetical protein